MHSILTGSHTYMNSKSYSTVYIEKWRKQWNSFWNLYLWLLSLLVIRIRTHTMTKHITNTPSRRTRSKRIPYIQNPANFHLWNETNFRIKAHNCFAYNENKAPAAASFVLIHTHITQCGRLNADIFRLIGFHSTNIKFSKQQQRRRHVYRIRCVSLVSGFQMYLML